MTKEIVDVLTVAGQWIAVDVRASEENGYLDLPGDDGAGEIIAAIKNNIAGRHAMLDPDGYFILIETAVAYRYRYSAS